jgi:hypothetical protein
VQKQPSALLQCILGIQHDKKLPFSS